MIESASSLGTISRTVYDVNGCTTSELILVELDRNRNVFIPNIFSPNGDDKNDYFGVATGPGVKKVNFIRVFDRWGELMFSRENVLAGSDPNAHGWDGRFRMANARRILWRSRNRSPAAR